MIINQVWKKERPMADQQTPPNTDALAPADEARSGYSAPAGTTASKRLGRSTGWPARPWAQAALSKELTIAPPGERTPRDLNSSGERVDEDWAIAAVGGKGWPPSRLW